MVPTHLEARHAACPAPMRGHQSAEEARACQCCGHTCRRAVPSDPARIARPRTRLSPWLALLLALHPNNFLSCLYRPLLQQSSTIHQSKTGVLQRDNPGSKPKNSRKHQNSEVLTGGLCKSYSRHHFAEPFLKTLASEQKPRTQACRQAAIGHGVLGKASRQRLRPNAVHLRHRLPERLGHSWPRQRHQDLHNGLRRASNILLLSPTFPLRILPSKRPRGLYLLTFAHLTCIA